MGVNWDIHSWTNWHVWSSYHIFSSSVITAVSEFPILVWTIDWADSLNRSCQCVCSIQESSCPELLSWFLLIVWFAEMPILGLRLGKFLFSLYILYESLLCIQGIVYISNYIYLPSWVELSKIFFQQISFFLLINRPLLIHLFNLSWREKYITYIYLPRVIMCHWGYTYARIRKIWKKNKQKSSYLQ